MRSDWPGKNFHLLYIFTICTKKLLVKKTKEANLQTILIFKILHNNVSLPDASIVNDIPVSVGRVSFDNLAALMQSETSPMSAFLAPVSLLLGVCHVTGAWEQTQTIGELSSGVRGVLTHYLYLH